MKKVIAVLLLLFVGYYVVSKPDNAAESTRNLLELSKEGGDSGVTFLDTLTNGAPDGGAGVEG